MLWTGLTSTLKDISAYKYESVKDFDSLRVALRQIEKEHKQRDTKKPQTNKAATNEPSELSEIKGLLQEFKGRMDTLEEKVTTHITTPACNIQQLEQQQWTMQQQYQPQRYPTQPYQPRQQYQQRPYQRPYNRRPYQPRGYQPRQWQPSQQWQQQQPPAQQQQTETDTDYQHEVQCYRCGQFGHIQAGCRVRLDHSRRHLNLRKPMQRSRP